jgi:hypothetical protein
MYNVINSPLIEDLFAVSTKPCLSLYLPTHRTQPERRDDYTRFHQLVRQLTISLENAYSKPEIDMLMAPFHDIDRDEHFWNQRKSGIVMFRAPGVFITQHLDRTVPELAIVADAFHVKPLFRLLQTTEEYHVLCVTKETAQLFVGNRDALQPVPIHGRELVSIDQLLGSELTKRGFAIANSGGMRRFVGYTTTSDEVELDTQRFFRAVDKLLIEEVPDILEMPLIVAGLAEQSPVYHSVSRNPQLVKESIHVNPLRLTLKELTGKAWQVIEPHIREQSGALIEAYDEAASRNGGIEGVFGIAHAAVEGRVKTLFVEDNRQLPGKIDEDTGIVVFDDLAQPDVNDVLDDIARLVVKKGGTVIVLPTQYMPTNTGAAAILRY